MSSDRNNPLVLVMCGFIIPNSSFWKLGNVSPDLLLHFKGANLSSFFKSPVVTCVEKVEEKWVSGLWWGRAGLWVARGALWASGRAKLGDFVG